MCKIEEIAAELERTGACEAWFKDCDAKVKKVCVMPFGLIYLWSRLCA